MVTTWLASQVFGNVSDKIWHSSIFTTRNDSSLILRDGIFYRDLWTPPTANNGSNILDDKWDQLVIVAQITDLHISKFQNYQKDTVSLFIDDVVRSHVKPDLVLITGDLVDAKSLGGIRSQQYEEEWQAYERIISRVPSSTIWLDLRGNHDCFGVPGREHPINYYDQYSYQRNYTYGYFLEKPFGSYLFLTLDACPAPGPYRPFNFFGYVDKSTLVSLERELKAHPNAHHVILSGHYPLSIMTYALNSGQGISFPEITRQITAYVCGHLHTLRGHAEEMYLRRNEGFLELELADLKDNSMYRLMVFDHDLFTFRDFRLKQYPAILITNPKPSNQVLPLHEPLYKMKTSTHIRILVFSPNKIVSVTWSIDQGLLNGTATQVHQSHPLFVSEWNPRLFEKGVHQIKVEVLDELGRKEVAYQKFRLDGFDQFENESWILWMPWELIAKFGFFICYVTTTFGLIVAPRFYGVYLLEKERRLESPLELIPQAPKSRHYSNLAYLGIFERTKRSLKTGWLRLVGLMTWNYSFYFIWLYALCFPISPWCFGNLTSHVQNWGYVSLTGLKINNQFVQMLDTWFFGFFYFALFFVPFILFMSFHHLEKWSNLHRSNLRSSQKHVSGPGFVVTLLWLILHFLVLLQFVLCYGYWTIIISPFLGWFLFIKIIVIRFYRKRFLRNLKETHMKP